MSAIPGTPFGEQHQVPAVAWALAWSYVLGQVLSLARHGTQPAEAWPGSVVLGIVLVTFFAHGVLRARAVRFWIVVVLTVLAAVAELWTLVDRPGASVAVDLALSAVQGWLLWSYRGTAWFAWQRTRPAGGPSLAPVLTLAVLVGVLGGLIGAQDAPADPGPGGDLPGGFHGEVW